MQLTWISKIKAKKTYVKKKDKISDSTSALNTHLYVKSKTSYLQHWLSVRAGNAAATLDQLNPCFLIASSNIKSSSSVHSPLFTEGSKELTHLLPKWKVKFCQIKNWTESETIPGYLPFSTLHLSSAWHKLSNFLPVLGPKKNCSYCQAFIFIWCPFPNSLPHGVKSFLPSAYKASKLFDRLILRAIMKKLLEHSFSKE